MKNRKRQLAAMANSTSASDLNESTGEEEEPVNDSGSNRNHSAVTRQGQGCKKKKVHNPRHINLLTVGSQRVVVPVSVQSVLLK